MSSSSSFLPFFLPDIGEDEIQAVVETLRSGWLTTGLKTKQFEQDFAAYIRSPHAVALNSCTAALHLALDAVGIKAGDEVLVPSVHLMQSRASQTRRLYFHSTCVGHTSQYSWVV